MMVTIGLAAAWPSTAFGASADAAQAAADSPLLRVAPGRVAFAMTADGRWKSFGLRGDRVLVKDGGVLVFAIGPDEKLSKLADAASGDTRSLTPGAIAMTHEGVHGGERAPSSFPDDDSDARVDEDALDGIDNDHDGAVDEDFAAIGDEMTAATFAPRNRRSLVIRQECYAWSLPHIDGAVVSAFTVRNAGHDALAGVRVGVAIETEERMTQERAPHIESSRWSGERDGDLVMQPVVLRGRNRAMALVLFAPRTGAEEAWELREDGATLVATSPALGDLAPDGETTVYVALIALPDDDLKVARAIHATARTVVGEGSTRLVPPPVSLTASDRVTSTRPVTSTGAGSGIDPFWNTPGKLLETLVVGSPNPFRDAIAIDYQVPERAVDEDGVEHALSAVSVSTSVKVYNVAGRLVATLVDTEHAPGRYRTGWTAHNDTGENVASGVYYVKLTIGKRSVTQRLVQLK
jgi:FlgD Ig-like domain